MEVIQLLKPEIRQRAVEYTTDCLETGWLSPAGEYVSRLERQIVDLTKAEGACATSSGTGALFLALKLIGVQPGDLVAVPTMTFIATVNAVVQCGAIPYFIDCDNTLNMDPNILRRSIIFNKENIIKAIIPVHMLGTLCSEEIFKIGCKYNIPVIEDAAQALGTHLKGKYAGTFGDLGVFSFSFNKIISSGGGGMLVGNKYIAERAKYLATQAKDNALWYVHNESGYNLSMMNLNAAVGSAQMEQIDYFIRRKKEIYNKYFEAFGRKMVQSAPNTSSNRWLSAIDLGREHTTQNMINELSYKGIETRPLFKPNHKQLPFMDYVCDSNTKGSNAGALYNRVLCLPSGTGLTDKEQDYIINTLYKLIG